MFEQSLVIAGPANRWPMFSSLLLQAAGVSVLLLVPLIWVEELPPMPLLPPEVFAPRTLKPMPVFAKGIIRRTTAPALATPRAFVAPSFIPRRVADIVDRTFDAAPQLDIGVSTGPVGALVNDALGSRLGSEPPPPPPKAPEPKPAAQGPKSINVTSSLQASKLVHQVRPAYPEIAKRAAVQGTVRLQAVIAQDGTVQRLQVVSGHPLLVQAAVEAVRQWRYSPTLLGGNPVEVVTQVDVNFVLAR